MELTKYLFNRLRDDGTKLEDARIDEWGNVEKEGEEDEQKDVGKEG